MGSEGKIDELIATHSNPYRRPCWLDHAPDELRSEIEASKRKFRAGAYTCPGTVVARAIGTVYFDKTGRRVTADTIRKWLDAQ